MRRRIPSPAMVVALVALVLSTTGLADAARRAVISSFGGHPVSTKPRAGGVLLLGRNRKFPAVSASQTPSHDTTYGPPADGIEI